ncbi:hypothetical protein [Chryseobacterium sp.]|uniref:hypothetical protein n=1 Tax=Chryseobacterium sp. TaxID=1871047 RepID=UPI0025BAD0A8|nr:hypothetical protein [Chryseobacterium sp.]
MTRFTEPYYLVDFNSSLCNFDIFINDLPAFTHHTGGSISSHIPVNHFILQPGVQKVKINVLPLNGETSLRPDGFFKVKIFSYDSSTEHYENTDEAFRYEQDFSQHTTPVKDAVNEFKAEVNYTVSGWSVSEPLDTKSLDQNAIIQYFRMIYMMFKEKNIEGIHQEMKDKFEEIDTSMYLGIVDNKLELSKLFEELAAGNYILEEFPRSTALKFFAAGRVCTLTGTGERPVIHYTNKETNEEFSLPLLIHKKNNKYSIIR